MSIVNENTQSENASSGSITRYSIEPLVAEDHFEIAAAYLKEGHDFDDFLMRYLVECGADPFTIGKWARNLPLPWEAFDPIAEEHLKDEPYLLALEGFVDDEGVLFGADNGGEATTVPSSETDGSSEDSDRSEQAIDGWSPPILLGFQEQLPPFPLESLPVWLRDFVTTVARFTQTPPDLAAVLGLAVLATVLAKRYVVRVRSSWIEPVNLYLIVALASGERKSAVFRLMVHPVRTLEAGLRAAASPRIREAEVLKKTAEADAKAAQKAAENAPPDMRDEMLHEALEARERADAITVPPWPRLLADDATPEALGTLLAQQDGKMSVLSEEGGGVLEIVAGRYTDARPNVDLFLKGHSGDSITVDRVSRAPESIEDPALTMGLTVQPEVVHGLARPRGFRGRGLLARFLYSVPLSRVGRREIEPEGIDETLLQEYERAVLDIATTTSKWEQAAGPTELSLDSSAHRQLVAFQKKLEPDLAKTGRLGHIADWGGKLSGAALRIAALLHVATYVFRTPPSEISSETMEAALAIAEYFVPHALSSFDLMGTDQVVDDARRVLAWLKDGDIEEFSAREAFQALKGTFKKMTRLNEALVLLKDHHFLAEIQSTKKRGPGRPQSPVFWVSPWVHKGPTS